MNARELSNLLVGRASGLVVAGYPIVDISLKNGAIDLLSKLDGVERTESSQRTIITLASMFCRDNLPQTQITFHGMPVTGVLILGDARLPLHLRCRASRQFKAEEGEDCLVYFCRLLELHSAA